jgi:hypothetical protein
MVRGAEALAKRIDNHICNSAVPSYAASHLHQTGRLSSDIVTIAPSDSQCRLDKSQDSSDAFTSPVILPSVLRTSFHSFDRACVRSINMPTQRIHHPAHQSASCRRLACSKQCVISLAEFGQRSRNRQPATSSDGSSFDFLTALSAVVSFIAGSSLRFGALTTEAAPILVWRS